MNKSIKTTAFTLAEGATHVKTCDSSRKAAFTLAEGATHVETCDSSNKTAFTLAEVMIVVAIIGVVATLVLPSFIKDMSERINSNRQANIVQKITKSVELMVANGEYSGIYNTEQFVDKLSKYLKIAKQCDYEHVADCWPVQTIQTANGESYSVSTAQNGSNLYLKTSTNNVGLILADGASLILNFNPNTVVPTSEVGFTSTVKDLPIGSGRTKSFPYSSTATAAIDFVMDVNGGNGPNREPDLNGNYYDIRSFKFATFTPQACPGGIRVAGYCLVDIGKDYNYINCKTTGSDWDYCDHCGKGRGQGDVINYVAGANKACDQMGLRQPSVDELKAISRISGKSFDGYSTSAQWCGRKCMGISCDYQDYLPVVCISN